MSDAVRAVTVGRAIPLPGNDIDTDRIIPARYLKSITFDGLGEAAFIDARAADRAAGRTHALDDARYAGASILLVGAQLRLRLVARARAAGAAAVRHPRPGGRVVRGDLRRQLHGAGPPGGARRGRRYRAPAGAGRAAPGDRRDRRPGGADRHRRGSAVPGYPAGRGAPRPGARHLGLHHAAARQSRPDRRHHGPAPLPQRLRRLTA